MPLEFNEKELCRTFKKLKNMKNDLDSISLAHFGVFKDEHFDFRLNNMEKVHHETKEAIIQWYSEKPSVAYVASKYHEKFIPNSTIHTKENIHGLVFLMNMIINGLKKSGFIK